MARLPIPSRVLFVTLCLTLFPHASTAQAAQSFTARPVAAGSQKAGPQRTAREKEVLAAREAVWHAWFSNDRATLESLLPPETIAVDRGEEKWHTRDDVIASAAAFAAGGGKLVRLEFHRVEIQLYGDVAILYSEYEWETEEHGKRDVASGRATEVFVRRDARWVNTGWHLDSGR